MAKLISNDRYKGSSDLGGVNRRELDSIIDLYTNIATLFFFLSMQCLAPYLSQVAIDLGATEFLVSLVGTMYAITSVGLRPVSGLLNDRGHSHIIIFLGSLMMTLSILTYLFAKDLYMLYLGRAFQGVSIALFIPTSLYIASTGPENIVAKRIANRSLLISLAATVGPLIGGFLISIGSWRTLFIGSLFISLIPVYASYKIYSEANNNSSRVSKSASERKEGRLREVFKRRFVYLLLINYLFSSSYAALVIFMPAHHKIYGLDPRYTAFFFTLSSISNLGVRFLYREIIREEILIKYAFLGLSLSSLAMLFVSLDPSDLRLIYLAAPLSGAGMGFTIPSLQSLALTSLSREIRGVGSSIYTVMFDLANMISPPLLILLAHRYDEAIKYSVITLMISLSILYLFLREKEKK